jgi:uncharacterized protein with HEPN domain
MWRDEANLLDMLIWARRASDYGNRVGETEFLADRLVQDATIRCLEVIGEAAGRVSPEFREAHSEIPWALITGMRNRLAHEYGHVDVFEVRIVAIRDCPKLVVRLEELVPDSADGLPEEWEFL